MTSPRGSAFKSFYFYLFSCLGNVRDGKKEMNTVRDVQISLPVFVNLEINN